MMIEVDFDVFWQELDLLWPTKMRLVLILGPVALLLGQVACNMFTAMLRVA
jgi:hypothetical protein